MLQYLTFFNEVSGINKSFNLNSNEIQLLNLISKIHFSQGSISLIDIAREKPFRSRSFVNKYIDGLVDKNLLSLELSQFDGRTKAISLTKMGLLRCKELDRAVKRAARRAQARK